ncbi:MAG: hypothetical protein QOE70_3527 [Chthoniobacter sp.]|nr:hypothetical protein [Chthoniobacter sp.]
MSGNDELVRSAWLRLALATTGILAAIMALGLSVAAFFQRRQAWRLSTLVGMASVGAVWFFAVAARQPFAGVVAQLQGSTATAVTIAQRPIPQEKEALTAAQVRPSLVAWGEEAMVRPYQEHGHHDAAWDEAALQLIRGTALELAGSPASPGAERLRALGAEIRRAGCDDPWVLFLFRRLAEDDPDYHEAMEKAAAAVTSAGYPPFPIWLARTEALRAARRDEPDAAGALAPGCLEALRGALSARPLEAGDDRAWCQLFFAEPGRSLLEQDGEGVCRVVESVPGLQEWFVLVVRGRSEIEQAWLARGSGNADTVRPEQWQRFRQHLAMARAALERSSKLQPNEPEAARALITVELGSAGLEEMRRRFESAVQARFDYLPAYESFRRGLLPRWFGSEQAVLAFGRTCLATQRFDTEVPWQMMRAVQDVAAERDDPHDYYSKEAPWKDLQAMLDGYVAHGDPARRDYYLAVKAVLAARRGLDDVVAQMLEQLNYQIDPQVVADWNLSIQWVGRMATLSGPAADLALAAQRQENEHPKQALESLLAAQKLPGLPPVANDYLADQIAEVRAVIALQGAPWRPLTPPEDLSGWKADRGEWRVVLPTVLEVTTGSGALLTRLQPIGETWELRGEIDLGKKGRGRAEAALFCGPAGEQELHGFSLRFWTKARGRSGISLARGFAEDALSKQTDFGRTIPFLVRLANHRLRVFANQGQWFANQPLPAEVVIDRGAMIGLGSTGGGERTLQFRKLEWRAIDEGR